MDVPPKNAPRLFLIDGYALIYRSYFAFINRPLLSSKGENTSAAWGVANFLFKVLEEFDPDYLAVVFDAGKSQRQEEYADYKATRAKMPEDLAESLPRLRELIEAFHCPILALEGYEADDVIGTLAAAAEARGIEAVIVSGDKDFYQLVSPRVHLLNPGRGGPHGVAAEWVDERNAPEKFGLPPEQVIDYLALIGDTSDNVPGAPGIGPKTAVKLLREHGSLDALLERATELKGKRAREALTEHAEQVRMSRRLVTIQKDLPVELDLDTLSVGPLDTDRLRTLLLDLEFRTLLDKLVPEVGHPDGGATAQDLTFDVVTDPSEVDALVERVRTTGTMVLMAYSTADRPIEGRLASLAIGVEPDGLWYLPFAHTEPGGLSLDLGMGSEVTVLPALTSTEMADLRALLEDPAVGKTGHDLKDAVVALALEGLRVRGLEFDAMIASYVLDPGRRHHDLPALSDELSGRPVPARDSVLGTGKAKVTFAEVSVEDAAGLGCQHVDAIIRLKRVLAPRIRDQGMDALFRQLEMPLIRVLSDMELTGIGVDEGFFHEMSVRVARELKQVQAEIFKIAGGEFNLNSTPQLREIMYERLELPIVKRTKTGPSTDSTVLEELAAAGHDLPRQLMDYRQLEKLRSTYIDALPRLVNRRTGRIHTSFNQTVAATGRLSSSDPNLQNIPIRTELGRQIRKGFVADEGFLLVAVDYSQVELRVLAHFSGDEAFLTAFRNRIDVHKQTASVIFDVPIDAVTSAMRAQAKTINFATIYGQGDFSLARQLGISRGEAKSFIEGYFDRFSGVRQYLDEQIASAKERGYVETLLGRRRWVPELRSKNWNIRSFGERVAQNTPIQGTAADLMKRAMIDVHEGLRELESSARLLLQVHDELLLEVPEAEVDTVRDLVVDRMENALELRVPLVADVGIGVNWYDCKG